MRKLNIYRRRVIKDMKQYTMRSSRNFNYTEKKKGFELLCLN